MKHKMIQLITIGALTLTLTGGAIVATPELTTSVQASSSAIKFNEKQIVKKFQKQFKAAKVSELKLEKHRGNYIYEVNGFDKQNEYDAKINAQTGKILKTKTEKLDADDHEIAINLNDVISRQKANQIAEKAAKSGHGIEWSLDNEHGSLVWQVDVKDGHQTVEVKIDAKTGQVITTEMDD